MTKKINKQEVIKLIAGRKQIRNAKAKFWIDQILSLKVGEGILIEKDKDWKFKSNPQQLMVSFFHNPLNYNLGVKIQTHKIDDNTFLFDRIK